MASKYPNQSDSDSGSKLPFDNVGHTITDDSSKSDSGDNAEMLKNKKKNRKARKLIVEKRPMSSDEDDSDKENKRQKTEQVDNVSNEEDIMADGETSADSEIYPNQMQDPNVQSLVWHQENDGC